MTSQFVKLNHSSARLINVTMEELVLTCQMDTSKVSDFIVKYGNAAKIEFLKTMLFLISDAIAKKDSLAHVVNFKTPQ